MLKLCSKSPSASGYLITRKSDCVTSKGDYVTGCIKFRVKADIILYAQFFLFHFFSLNDLESEIAAVRKELKEVEKVTGFI